MALGPDMPNDDSASGGGRAARAAAADAEAAPRASREWADDSVRGGFMTGKKGYSPDGMADVSVSSRYSDKEHLPSFRTDVGAGELRRTPALQSGRWQLYAAHAAQTACMYLTRCGGAAIRTSTMCLSARPALLVMSY